MAGQVYQVMETLDYGDAVSHIALDCDDALREAGLSGGILSIYHNERVADRRRDIDSVNIDADDVVLFHFWGQSRLEDWVLGLPCPKAIYYHNITPSHYFESGSPLFKSTRAGRTQLARIAGEFDIAIGDSAYNVRELFELEKHPAAGLVVHPPVDAGRNRDADEETLRQLKDDGVARFLFLGRLAPNKRQDEIIRVFEYYHTAINPQSRLDLVGNDKDNPEYVAAIRAQVQRSPARDAIQIPGKVSDEQVVSYLRAADIFLCLSEHEGFCVPLIQAMAEGAVVVAYEAAAVPETLDGAGVLVRSKDAARLAELIHVILQEDSLRSEIVNKQLQRAAACSGGSARERLTAAVTALRSGDIPGPEDFWLTPKAPYGRAASNAGVAV